MMQNRFAMHCAVCYLFFICSVVLEGRHLYFSFHIFMPHKSFRGLLNSYSTVKIKNVHRKKVTDEASGETNIVEEFHEIVNDDLEKFAKKPYAWRIMKKFVRDSGIELAYDGNAKAYSRQSVREKLEAGKDYTVTVKRDCEEDDPDADR